MVYPSSRRGRIAVLSTAEVHFAQNVKYWYMKYETKRKGKKNAFLESEFHEGNQPMMNRSPKDEELIIGFYDKLEMGPKTGGKTSGS